MTIRHLTLAAVAALSLSPASASAPQRAIVVELFTSQGCSSCPPADALLQRLSKEQGIIAITRPVTYWDRLGWKDTLAMPANTDLQRAYAAKKLPGAGVYTPGAVVQGRLGAVGSNEKRLRALIAQARTHIGPAITVAANGVRVSAGEGSGTVALMKLRPRVIVGIGSGENGGRRIEYTNMLTGMTPLGQWQGRATTFTLPKDARSSGGAAIILRSGSAGPVLAAARL